MPVGEQLGSPAGEGAAEPGEFGDWAAGHPGEELVEVAAGGVRGRLLVERAVRNGTTTLFAALEVATGKVTATCQPRHRHQEFLRFLKQLARAYPGVELHLVMDNYAAHKRVEIRTWLAANPRITVHFTPTSGSWLNLVEVWFGIIERQAIHRGTFSSVKDLNAKIRAFVDGWNDRAHPLIWTKTADDILKKANRKTTSNTDH